eukprot:gene6929-11092_t
MTSQEEKILSLTKEIQEKDSKIEELQRLLKVYSGYVPKEKLKYLKGTEEETHINYLQKTFKRKKNTQNLLNLLTRFSSSKEAQGLKEKNNILKEIVKTENDYVTSLIHLLTFYKDPIVKKKFFKDTEISEIFLNLDDLIKIHTSFLNKLQLKMDAFPKSDFGNLFLETTPDFLLYIHYCNKYNEAMNRINDLKKSSKEFSSFLDEQRKYVPSGHPLQSLFIQPIQRLPRYSLLLAEVIKKTDVNHLEYPNFVHAKEKLDEILQLVDENKKKYEIEKKIKRIEQFTADIMYFKLNYEKFLSEELAMVKFLPMKQKVDQTDPIEIESLLFLFQDIILMFEKTRKPRKVSFVLGSKPQSRKVHYDKQNEMYITFKKYFYLSESAVVKYKNKVIGLCSVDFETNQKVMIEIAIKDTLGCNRCDFWHENLLKYIDAAEKNNDVYHINPSSAFF